LESCTRPISTIGSDVSIDIGCGADLAAALLIAFNAAKIEVDIAFHVDGEMACERPTSSDEKRCDAEHNIPIVIEAACSMTVSLPCYLRSKTRFDPVLIARAAIVASAGFVRTHPSIDLDFGLQRPKNA
jgi:hypothetical protein